MQLASRFASHSPTLRSDYPLSDDQIRRVAPSIFADAPHESRSERYSYIPTAAVLTELRKEGFEPFMVRRPACAMTTAATTPNTCCACAMPARSTARKPTKSCC
jgi:hypothetical protein